MTNIQQVSVEKPEDINFILGQSHFIKSASDLFEACAAVPGCQFGLAFCEASGPRLLRYEGNDQEMVELAKKNALSIGCGHTFIVFLKPPTFPLHVLPGIKSLNVVCRIFCATANPTKVLVATSEDGEQRGIMGVLDGFRPLGVETSAHQSQRKQFLIDIGFKK